MTGLSSDKPKIFISHSNKYFEVCGYFENLIRSFGFTPIVVEKMPNYGLS